MGIVLGILFLVLLFVVPVWLIRKNNIKRSSCPKCKEFYDYERDIAWKVNSITNDNRREKSLVEFSCVCRKCGHVKNFTYEFITAEVLNAGTKWAQNKGYNLEKKTRELFLSNQEIEKIKRKRGQK